MENTFITNTVKQFEYYKSLGDKTIEQLEFQDLQWLPNTESNSIAVIVKHMAGNMLSRWTNFLTEDGEKPWRLRDQEFVDTHHTKEELIEVWESGWDCLFKAIAPLKEEDLKKIIYIRNQGHTIIEAINRQLAHYAYHIGQIVFIGKLIKNDQWKSLSIPKGKSSNYNQIKFSRDKSRKHFTDDV